MLPPRVPVARSNGHIAARKQKACLGDDTSMLAHRRKAHLRGERRRCLDMRESDITKAGQPKLSYSARR